MTEARLRSAESGERSKSEGRSLNVLKCRPAFPGS